MATQARTIASVAHDSENLRERVMSYGRRIKDRGQRSLTQHTMISPQIMTVYALSL